MEVADPAGHLPFPFGDAAVPPPVTVDMSLMHTLPPPPPLPAPPQPEVAPTPADHAAGVTAAAVAAAASALMSAGAGAGGFEAEGSAGHGGIGTVMAVDDDDDDGAGGDSGGGFGGGPHTPVTPAANGGTSNGAADTLPADDADVEARLRLLARAVFAVDFDDAKTKATVFIPRALIHNALLQLVPLVTGGAAPAPSSTGGGPLRSSPPQPPPPSASRLAAALATKRIGYWARAVFGLRSPKTARLETRRDVEVSFKGQPPALREPDVRSFLATSAAGHPTEDGRRIFSLRFFRLRLAADFRAPDCCLTAAEVAALRGVLAAPTVAAVMGVGLRTDEPGGAVTGLRIPPALVLSPHPQLGRALSYPQHGLRVGGKRPRGRGVSTEGGAAGPPLLAGDATSPSAGDEAAVTPGAAAAAASAAMVAAVAAAAAAAFPGGAASGAAAAAPSVAQPPGLPIIPPAVAAGPADLPAHAPSPGHAHSLLDSLPPVVLAGHPLHPAPNVYEALPTTHSPILRPPPPGFLPSRHPHARRGGCGPPLPRGCGAGALPPPPRPPPKGYGRGDVGGARRAVACCAVACRSGCHVGAAARRRGWRRRGCGGGGRGCSRRRRAGRRA